MVFRSVDHEIASLASGQHGVFSMSDLAEIGVSVDQRRQRLEAGRWTELHDGVYRIAGAPASWTADLIAACFAGGPGSVASHRSAAAL